MDVIGDTPAVQSLGGELLLLIELPLEALDVGGDLDQESRLSRPAVDAKGASVETLLAVWPGV